MGVDKDTTPSCLFGNPNKKNHELWSHGLSMIYFLSLKKVPTTKR